MIIKQYRDVIGGTKTQTRRMKDRYQVGRVYSVVPKMYHPSVWWRFYDGKYETALNVIEYRPTFNPYDSEISYDNLTRVDLRAQYSERGFQPLRIKVTDKRTEPLQNLTEDDARAEGIYWSGQSLLWEANAHGKIITGYSPIACYWQLWDSINTKKGLRWEDNPTVVVYTFEVVK